MRIAEAGGCCCALAPLAGRGQGGGSAIASGVRGAIDGLRVRMVPLTHSFARHQRAALSPQAGRGHNDAHPARCKYRKVH
jgi:hypothetical protein